jgi:serine/threonine protein kinase
VLGLALRAPGLGVTARAPRAVGVRTTYAAVPAHVRSWVERTLGSPVAAARDQMGGMSPGCATRLVCADGTRVFVKAVGTELNPDTPNLFRREVLTLGLLGSHPLWADLLDSYDDGDWVALLLEDVEGEHPDLTEDAVMSRLLDSTDQLGSVMQQRVPEPPHPDPVNGGLNDMALTYSRLVEGLEHATEISELLPPWVPSTAPGLVAAVQRLAVKPGRHLVHWDIRDDNLLLRPSGEIVFLDWGMSGVGPDWVDPFLARLERVEERWFDESVATSPALVRAGDEAVTTLLIGLGVWLAWRSHIAVDVNLPTLNDFRLRESRRFLAAGARRLGI